MAAAAEDVAGRAAVRETERPRPGRDRDTAASLPWRAGVVGDDTFPSDLLRRPVLDVARGLLGACLESTIGGARTVGIIVETEAYGGGDDPASHAATLHGKTDRNRAMFGPAGRAYVYRSYGVHWCMNVVTGTDGEGQAVLIRAVEALDGEDVMRRRRGRPDDLGSGPGRLCAALGITEALYGHDLQEAPLVLREGWTVGDHLVGVSRRVGVRLAADRPYRFFVRGSRALSRPESWGRVETAP